MQDSNCVMVVVVTVLVASLGEKLLGLALVYVVIRTSNTRHYLLKRGSKRIQFVLCACACAPLPWTTGTGAAGTENMKFPIYFSPFLDIWLN